MKYSSNLWTPDLWTDTRVMKNPQIGGCTVFSKRSVDQFCLIFLSLQAKCEPCPVGYECSNTNGVSTISACPSGQYSAEWETTCSTCPTDHVCPPGGIPYRCRYGQKLESNRCVTEDSLISYSVCPAGWSCDSGTTDPNQVCPPGTYSYGSKKLFTQVDF